MVVPTLSIPRVIDIHRNLPNSGLIIIVGDHGTPDEDVLKFTRLREEVVYLSPQEQTSRKYRSSELIGWNTIARRNIGILEAIRLGADSIITIDDDNIPVSIDFFSRYKQLLETPYYGVSFSSHDGTLNIGNFFSPRFYHRGFPLSLRSAETDFYAEPAIGVKIGVAAGMWLGDPDINAVNYSQRGRCDFSQHFRPLQFPEYVFPIRACTIIHDVERRRPLR